MSLVVRAGGLLFVALLSGCSAELEQYNADADTGSTHALIQVQRTVSADGTTAPRADALAGFIRVPADMETRPIYELLGLRSAVPSAGECRVRKGEVEATPSLLSIGRVELLDAGDVSIGAPGGEATLAPHAFPTVTDLVSGVVYTTRDRSSALLPAATRYAVHTTGGLNVPGISVREDAPAELASVTLGGAALSDVGDVSVSQPVDLTWAVGSPGDRVVAELSSADGAVVAACTFRDEAGAGSIPGGTLAALGAGRIALHRMRNASFKAAGVDSGEIDFDFELAQGVNFVR